MILRFAIAAIVLFHAGHAAAQTVTCTAPQSAMLDIELLLGRGEASEARWKRFLAREVTPPQAAST